MPSAFRSEILSPRFGMPYVLSPEAFIAEILSPRAGEPRVLSPEALIVQVLSPGRTLDKQFDEPSIKFRRSFAAYWLFGKLLPHRS